MDERLVKLLRHNRVRFFIPAGIVLVFLAITLFWKDLPRQNLLPFEMGVKVQSLCLILFLAGIPASFFVYNSRCNKWRRLDDIDARIAACARASRRRMLVLDVLMVVSLLLLFFTDMQQAKTFFTMVAIFYCFVIPSKGGMLRDLNVNEDGTDYQPEPAPEPEKVGDIYVVDENDDFIPRAPQQDGKEPQVHGTDFLDD